MKHKVNKLDLRKDRVMVVFKVLFPSPSDSERSVYKSNSTEWSSLMSVVNQTRYSEKCSTITKLRTILKEQVLVNDLLPLLECKSFDLIGRKELIQVKYLFDRSPLDLQLYILAGLGFTVEILRNIIK